MERELKELTKAEEQVMQVLWEISRGFVKDVIEKIPEPKPAYNTVSTVIRVLESKGFIDHQAFGKTHQYFPVISKEEYKNYISNKLLDGYFENSVESMLSFFFKKQKIDLKEADEILKLIEKFKEDK